MQDMIRKIVEADAKARRLEEVNKKTAAKEKQKIEVEAAAIHQRYMDHAQAEIVKNDAYLEKRFARRLTDMEAKQKSALIKLKADYEQSRDRWVDEIVSRVIG